MQNSRVALLQKIEVLDSIISIQQHRLADDRAYLAKYWNLMHVLVLIVPAFVWGYRQGRRYGVFRFVVNAGRLVLRKGFVQF